MAEGDAPRLELAGIGVMLGSDDEGMLVRDLIEGGGGAVLNASSVACLNGNFGQTNYGAAKAGVAGFTRCLALEGKKYGIRVWGLAPIAVTRMTEDLPGMGTDEVAQVMDRVVGRSVPTARFCTSETLACREP